MLVCITCDWLVSRILRSDWFSQSADELKIHLWYLWDQVMYMDRIRTSRAASFQLNMTEFKNYMNIFIKTLLKSLFFFFLYYLFLRHGD